MHDLRLEFYDALWGNSQLYRSIWYGEKGTPPNKSKWFTETTAALSFADSLNSSKQYNVYHACSIFDKESRKQKDVALIKAFWLDLDIKQTKCTSLHKLATTYLPLFKDFELTTNYWVVNTGNGFHIYWMLKTPITRELWAEAAKNLTTYCKSHDIPHERETDSASLLRVLGSWNVKSDTPKEVKLILNGTLNEFTAENTQKTDLKLDVSALSFNKDDYNLNEDLGFISHLECDADIVARKCGLIGQFKRDGLDDSEPLWHFALGVVRNCIDGIEKAHEFSSKSKRYNEKETSDKLATLLDNGIKPCLCETFESYGCTYCAKCQYKGKIKTPIQLGAICHTIDDDLDDIENDKRSEEHTSELQSHSFISYAVFCLKKKNNKK